MAKDLESVMKMFDEEGHDIQKMQEHMPGFLELYHRLSSDGHSYGIEDEFVDEDQGIGAVLRWLWFYSGRGGCECGAELTVYRDGKTQTKYFKYRDSYDADKDNDKFKFDTIKKVSATDESLKLELESEYTAGREERIIPDDERRTYVEVSPKYRVGNLEYTPIKKKYTLEQTIKLPKQKIDEKFTSQEYQDFKQHMQHEIEKLRDLSYIKDARMSQAAAMYGTQGYLGACYLPKDSSYVMPEVLSEFIATDKLQGVVVIKSQIDARAGSGKQFEFAAYRIDKDKCEKIDSKDIWESELADGKSVDMHARDYYEK